LKANLETVYFSKMKQIVSETRFNVGQKESDKNADQLRKEFLSKIGGVKNW